MSYANQRKSRNCPAWLLGGWPGFDTAFRLRMLLRAAWLESNGHNYEKEAAMAKYFASDVAMRAAIEGVQIFGGYGYIKEYPAERHMRDAKICQIYEGTNEIQRVVVARKLLGLR